MRQTLAQIHVQIGEGLVQQKQLRLWGQGAGQSHPLLLPSREFVGVTLPTVVQSHQSQNIFDAGTLPVQRPAVQAKRDVLRHIQMRKQRIVLEHHANAALLWRQMDAMAADHHAIDADLTRTDFFQTRHGAQQRGLAATRGADQHAHLPGLQLQADAVDRCDLAAWVVHLQGVDLEKHAADCRHLTFLTHPLPTISFLIPCRLMRRPHAPDFIVAVVGNCAVGHARADGAGCLAAVERRLG